MDGTFDPNNSQLFFRALQAPLNTVDNTFYSLGAAQSNDPSLRINKYDASGALLNYGYLYDTQFNPLPPGALLIVAGGIGTNTLVYSTDGQSWIPSQTGLANACLTIAYDGFTWLAGGIDNTGHITVVYSSNGQTWLPNIGGSTLFTQICTALATNGSLWVGGGRNGDALIGFSYDGLQWLEATTEFIFTGTNISAIAQNDLLWLAGATAYNNGTVLNALGRSLDGIHWLPVDLSGTPIDNVYSICWNGAVWVVGGDLNGVARILYSTDSFAWFVSTNATVIPSSIRALSWNGLQFVAGGYDSAGLGRTLAYSYNGITWTASTTTIMFPYYCNGVTWDGNRWEAIGIKGYNGGFSIASSADGITWLGNLSATNALPQGYAIAVNSPLPFVAPKTPNPSVTAPLSLIAGINPEFGSAIGYSTDGITWEFLPDASIVAQGCQIASPTWNGTLWVAGTGPEADPIYAQGPGFPTLIYSYDGITWNVSTSGTSVANRGIGAISWGIDKFIGIGGFWYEPDYRGSRGKCVIQSTDGINWSRIDAFTTFSNSGIQFGVVSNGTFWLLLGTIGGGITFPGTYYSLDDGVTWQPSISANTVFPGGSALAAWNGHVWSLISRRISIDPRDLCEAGYSYDGINWMLGTLHGITTYQATSLFSNGSIFIMSGQVLPIGTGTSTSSILYSYDGIDYYPVSYIPNGLNTYILSVNWTGSLWVATGIIQPANIIGVVLYSYNGVYWYPSYKGSEYLTSEFNSYSATNRVNPTAGNTLPPAVLNQGFTSPSGNMIYTDKANNLYKSSVLTLDQTNGIVGINQTSQTYTDLSSSTIRAALEISGGAIIVNTYRSDSVPGLYLTANNVNAGSGGRIEFRDAVNQNGWRIDNNANVSNHLQIKNYNSLTNSLVMDFGTTQNVGIGTIADNSYKLKVDGSMNVTGTVSAPTKSFLIDHPDPALTKTHYLRHSCVEGPTRGDTLYRWTITTTLAHLNSTIQPLPSYSPYLNENWQFIVRAIDSFGRGYVTLSACETFFTLTTNQEGTYSILGIATRKDEAALAFDKQGVEFVPVK
jgi:hypothetical protein